MIPEEVKAYTAGIIDGEGTICITERSRPSTRRCKTPSFVISVVVSMTNIKAVEFIHSYFKGRLRQYTRKEDNHRKPYYRFDASCSQEVKELLIAIYPYIKTKKKHVELALQYLDMPMYSGGKGQVVPDYIVDARRAFVVEMKRLNQGGE